MARVISINGVAKGKLGATVYSVSGGQMIARQYQPYVANPNTEAQVDNRAKLKLMSQIAAALAPVIAIPKDGLKSSRNLFIKKNYGYSSANSGVAQVTYENLQLTNGNAGLPALVLHRDADSGISVNLDERCDAAVSRVVYILYRKTSEATLQYVQSIIVDAAGSEGKFPGTLIYVEGDIVVFAYGMKDLNSKATAKYSNYNVLNGEDIAKLALSRNISTADYQFTQTRGTTLFAGETDSVQVGANQARVYVTASGPGSVSGAGVFDLGSEVTVHAVPSTGARFRGWKVNGASTYVSTNTDYTFTLDGMTDLVAEFYTPEAVPTYQIDIEGNYADEYGQWGQEMPAGISVPSSVSVEAGQSVTLQTSKTGTTQSEFVGWYDVEAGRNISSQMSYTFTPNASTTIECRWKEISGD